MTSRRRRTLASLVAAVGVGLSAALGVAPASATTQDEQFIEAMNKLGITFADGTDIPGVGRGACASVDAGANSGFRNPVTAVRGVVTALESSGLTSEQAVGLLQVSVLLYCPQYRAFMPR